MQVSCLHSMVCQCQVTRAYYAAVCLHLRGKNPPVYTMFYLKNAGISMVAIPVTRSFVDLYFCLNKNIQNLFISIDPLNVGIFHCLGFLGLPLRM